MKVLWFCALKVAEISGMVFIPHYLGKFVHLWTGFFCEHEAVEPSCMPMWWIGFFWVIIAVAIGLLLYASDFFEMNWEWAGKLNYRLKK